MQCCTFPLFALTPASTSSYQLPHRPEQVLLTITSNTFLLLTIYTLLDENRQMLTMFSSENNWSGELGSANLFFMHADPTLRSELVEIRAFLP